MVTAIDAGRASANGALDVRLMRTLVILLTECSVSRTAEILGQSQPTISLTLKRLRELIGDPLLVRTGSSLVPTDRGLTLRDTVKRLLDEIDGTLSPNPAFDPGTSQRCFRIVASNCLGAILMPRLIQEIQRVAPSTTIDFCPTPRADDFLPSLASGHIDLVVGNWPHPPQDLKIAPLLSTDVVCIVGPHHPLAGTRGPLALSRYLQQRHISPTSQQSAMLSPIDGHLVERGLRRRIAMTIPEYALVPPILLQSDLMFTTGRPFAEYYRTMYPFSVIEAPQELSTMEFYMLWHGCKHASPWHIWLRQFVRSVTMRLARGEEEAAPSGACAPAVENGASGSDRPSFRPIGPGPAHVRWPARAGNISH